MTRIKIDAVLEERTISTNSLAIYILGSRVVVAIIPYGITVTDELAALLSDEWAKPKYSCSHPVPLERVIELNNTLR